MSYRRFCDCSVSERILYTLFIGLLGTGYLFAMVLLFISVSHEDGQSGLSVKDISIKYKGERSVTKLEQALGAAMKPNRSEGEYLKITAWIHDGAKEDRFNEEIKPIVDAKCVMCHTEATGMGLPDFNGYDNIMKVVAMDTGDTVATLVRVSHIHLFGLGIIFYLLGRIFVLTSMPVTIKRVIVVVPFAAIAIDIGSWWFLKFSDNIFAYTVMGGGALMGFSFAVQSFVSLYQMWFFKNPLRGDGYAGGERRGEYRRRGE